MEKISVKVNTAKTKAMIISNTEKYVRIGVTNHEVEQVNRFKHLGKTVNSRGDIKVGIIEQIENARRPLNNKQRYSL